jgi:hypothetical protein
LIWALWDQQRGSAAVNARATALADQGQRVAEVGNGAGPTGDGCAGPLELHQAALDPGPELSYGRRSLASGSSLREHDLDAANMVDRYPYSASPRRAANQILNIGHEDTVRSGTDAFVSQS